MIDDLDLKILKVITSDNLRAVEFANAFSEEIFNPEHRLFANLVLRYIRGFRSFPTRRVLAAWSGEPYTTVVNKFFNKLDSFQYNQQEYPFDLEVLKVRYSKEVIDEIGKLAGKEDAPNQVAKEMGLRLQKLRTINDGKTFIQKTVKEHLLNNKENKNVKVEGNENDNRILTHYSALDYCLGGLRPAELLVVGAESGQGKSMLLLNITKQMWMQGNTIDTIDNFSPGFNILFLSLEMPFEDMYNRFLASLANVPERSILDKILTTEEQARVDRAEQFIANYPYEFEIVDVPRGLTVNDIELRYRDAKLKYQPHVVAIDYLTLMKSPERSKEPDWLKVGELAGDVHEFGRTNHVSVCSALQLTDIQRGSKTDPKEKSKGMKIGPHRIGRSSAMLHHMNVYLQIETRVGEENYADLKFHVIKNRRGPAPKNCSLRKNFANSLLLDIQYIPPEQNREFTAPEKTDEGNETPQRQPDIHDKLKSARERIDGLKKSLSTPNAPRP